MQKERPLSPHLQVYDMFQLTSALSFMHRGTGVFLMMGSPLLVLWLCSLASGPAGYAALQACSTHWLGQLFLIGWTFSLFYHLCNGIRHLFWDAGSGFEIESVYTSGKIVMIVSAVLTIATCWMAFTRLTGAGGAV